MEKEVDGKKFRGSDQSIALGIYVPRYREKGEIIHVKPFDGGRTAEERLLFTGVTDKYIDLLEVKASYDGGNYSTKVRQEYRYIIGKRRDVPDAPDVIIGIARHSSDGDNKFNAFFPLV